MPLANKFYGPFTLTFRDFAAGTKVYSGLKRDTISLNIETLADRMEFEDGSAIDTESGRRTVLEGDISDVIAADFDTLESYRGNITILFTKPNKTITLPGTALQPNSVHASMVDGKMHVKAMCNWKLGTTHATAFQIA